MGIFSRKKNRSASPAVSVDLQRSYISLNRFNGTKRLGVSNYQDPENGEENAKKLLGDNEHFDCTSSEITLTSFRHESGSGIKVAVDGAHVGVVWDTYYDNGRDPIYAAAYSGRIEGVFVRIESGRVPLFVKA